MIKPLKVRLNIVEVLTVIVLTASLCGLTGCVSVLPDPDPANAVYRLTTDVTRTTPFNDAPVIRIDTPSAARLLTSRQIIVSPDATRMAVASGAEWSDSLPKMIQQTFLDILGERPEIVGVIPISGARANYRIHLNVDNFEARFDNGPDNPPLVIVAYTATFANSGTRNLVATKQVTERIRASAYNVSSIVGAMDEANQTVLNDIADWLVSLKLKM